MIGSTNGLDINYTLTVNWLWGAQKNIPPVCQQFSAAYHSGIQPRILKGLPFELMATMESNKNAIFKKILYLQYDLWDEIVTVKEHEHVIFKINITQLETPLCQALSPSPSEQKVIVGHIRYSLVINPMWEGRLARLKTNLLATTKMKIIQINWNNVLYQLPAEEILIDQELPSD